MTRALLLSIAIAILAPAPALADQAIAELGRDAPVAGYGGWKAWSRYDEGTARFTLMLRAPDDTVAAAPVAASSRSTATAPCGCRAAWCSRRSSRSAVRSGRSRLS